MRPPSRRLTEGEGGWLEPGGLVCHVLLVETDRDGLILVDTGFGTRDVSARSLPWAFIAMAGAALDPAETAIARVRALGFDPRDVRHVVPTHLDLDHAGGLPDFPWATVHANARERGATRSPRSAGSRPRFPSSAPTTPRSSARRGGDQQRVRIGSRARSCAAGDANFFAAACAHIFSR